MLTNENYFSKENQLKYMGVSQFKAFEKCPAAAYAEVMGQYEREKSFCTFLQRPRSPRDLGR